MEQKIYEKRELTISPNKIYIPLSDKENGITDEYIQTQDNNCKEIFTCSICACLAWDPVSCPKCDKIFCRSCRLNYGENKICPFRCDSFTFREITRNEKDFLNNIKLKCTNFGCSQYISYCEYISHLEKCPFRKFHCKNDPCKIEGYFNEMLAHSQICKYKKEICKNCKQKVKFCDLNKHQNSECPEIIVICKFCGTKMKRGIYLKDHKSDKNDNPNCLKIQIQKLDKAYKEDKFSKNNEILRLRNTINELKQKKKVYETENNNLKKNLEEIKLFIRNGYNKFISLENNEKNIDEVLNINNEINKKNEIILNNNNEIKKKIEMNEKYSKTETNFYPKNNKNKDINRNDLNNDKYNCMTERKYNKILISNKKENKKEIRPPQLIQHLRKNPSLNYLQNQNNSHLEIKNRIINPFKK